MQQSKDLGLSQNQPRCVLIQHAIELYGVENNISCHHKPNNIARITDESF
ncbi:hypothetical protein NMY3_02188 [Candidatus Nitrosocosmicus oleophilus]|uniref:Uncharacterized protein n=1 Tax=Candidatus Nitrosocosmicus oleophilus TaxID=1353260 RepID=A0A654LY07_9ARCH|nr:hypothetical protein NMY3_02188 [Candidatus Nitrosocosmicus oleophilus]